MAIITPIIEATYKSLRQRGASPVNALTWAYGNAIRKSDIEDLAYLCRARDQAGWKDVEVLKSFRAQYVKAETGLRF